MTARHCSDEVLIAFADGELSEREHVGIEQHLRRCWSCRFRLKELQDAAHLFTEAVASYRLRNPTQVVDARLRFERQALSQPALGSGRAPRAWWNTWAAAAAATCLAGVLAVALLRAPQAGEQNASRRVLEAIEAADAPSPGPVVAQALEVQFKEFRPVRKEYWRRLEVALDPNRQHYQSTLRTPAGVLRHALWRAGDRELYRYDSIREPMATPFARATRSSGLPERHLAGVHADSDLESSLLKWLEERDWTPVSLARSFAVFAEEGGSVLLVHRIKEDDGIEKLALTVARREGGGILEAVLEADPTSHLPRVLRIRYRGPAREYEVALRPVRSASIPTVTFRPDPALLGSIGGGRSAGKGKPADRPPSPPIESNPSRPAVALSADREIAVLYALHSIKACFEPLELQQSTDEDLVLRGVVRDDGRKDQVIASLAPMSAWLQLDLRTAAEEFADATSDETTHIAMAPEHVRSEVLARIEDRFRKTGASNPGQWARAFRDQALSLSGRLLSEALELNQLSLRLTSQRGGALSSASERLLFLMLRDHAAAAEEFAITLSSQLAPVLTESLEPASGQTQVSPLEKKEPLADFDETSVADLARQAYDLQNQILGAGMSVVHARGQMPAVLATLSRIRSRCHGLNRRLTARLESEQ